MVNVHVAFRVIVVADAFLIVPSLVEIVQVVTVAVGH